MAGDITQHLDYTEEDHRILDDYLRNYATMDFQAPVMGAITMAKHSANFQKRQRHLINTITKEDAQNNATRSKQAKSLKGARRQLKGGQVQPLTYVKRSSPGPQGQPAGTYATAPREVDSIVRGVWDRIFQRNVEDEEELIRNFEAQYHAHIYRGPSANVDPITPKQLQRNITNANDTASGMDGWDIGDWKHLGEQAFFWLAKLLNLIEEQHRWPDDLKHARQPSSKRTRPALRTPPPSGYY